MSDVDCRRCVYFDLDLSVEKLMKAGEIWVRMYKSNMLKGWCRAFDRGVTSCYQGYCPKFLPFEKTLVKWMY